MDYFFETTNNLPWGRMEPNEFNSTNAEQIVRFVQTHERNNYPDDEHVTRDILHAYVEYVRFIRSEFVTRGSIAIHSWLPLWHANELAYFMIDNIFCGHMNRSDMSTWIGVCCKLAEISDSDRNPLSIFGKILTVSDDYKMTREDRLNRFVQGFKNAKHFLIEYSP